MTTMVSTTNGTDEGISKVDFYVEDELFLTASEPPFGFSTDLNDYEDETEFTMRVDVYDLTGEIHFSESSTMKIDNSPEPTLKALAEELGIEWGETFSNLGAIEDKLYTESVCQNFSLIMTEAVNMSMTQPQQGEWDFSWLDPYVELAKINDMIFRGHPLVMGNNLDWIDDIETVWLSTPLWVHTGDFSREDMIDIMYDHIETMMTRHMGEVDEWVVVNEPFGGYQGEQGIVLKNTVWTQKLGDDFVELAFKYARQIDPDVKLILNEVGVDYLGQAGSWSKRVDGFYLYVQDLLDKGTPIDVVGFEFHLTVGEDDPTVEDIVNNFKRYGELGLEVYVTELDIKIPEPVTPEKLEEQARIYGIVMQAVLESEYCNSITTWTHSDKYNWITAYGSFPGYTAAAMFDEDMQPKPAYYAIIEVMEEYLNK